MQITPDYNPTGAARGVELLILNAQTVDETKSTVVCPGSLRNHTFTIKVSAAVTGTIQLETANDPTYTGIWAPLGGGPIDLSAITAAGELQMQFSNIALTAVRARIETVVAGGTVSVTYLGDK